MKSEVDHRDAFQLYWELGPERSANKLTQVLKERGFKIGRDTINRWRHEHEWDKRLPEVDAARALEREAARLKHEAAQVLEEAGAKPAEALKPIRAVTVTDFTQEESTAAASMRVNAMVAAMAATCMDHIGKIESYLEPAELILFVNATRDLARAAGDLHRAVIQQPSKAKDGKGEEAHAPAPARPDGAFVLTDVERRKAALASPPRLRDT